MIKLLVTTDWHLRETNPFSRKDNFLSSQSKKVEWICSTANKLNVNAVIVAGDIFDAHTAPYSLVSHYIEILRELKCPFLTVFGQHDLRYHSYKNYKNTPLHTLSKAIKGTLLSDDTYSILNNIAIKGCSWKQPYPTVVDNMINIMVIHKLITENGPAWPGHVNYTTGTDILKETTFDIILSGDFHQSFSVDYKERLLINAGPVSRLNSDTKEYQPRVALIEIDDNKKVTHTWINIPIDPPDVVFNTNTEEQKAIEEEKDELNSFVLSLQEYSYDKPDFLLNLTSSLDLIEEAPVKLMIQGIMDEIAIKK